VNVTGLPYMPQLYVALPVPAAEAGATIAADAPRAHTAAMVAFFILDMGN